LPTKLKDFDALLQGIKEELQAAEEKSNAEELETGSRSVEGCERRVVLRQTLIEYQKRKEDMLGNSWDPLVTKLRI
jgi:hypothetical protein